MRARAVVSCRLGGKNAGGTHSRPELREWTRTSRPSGDVEGQKEEASTNVSVLSGQLSVTVPPPVLALHRLSSIYLATQHDESSNLCPFLSFSEAKFTPGLCPRLPAG